jgi:hypothetical protein
MDERRQENRKNTTGKIAAGSVRNAEIGEFRSYVVVRGEEIPDRRWQISPPGTRLERKIRAFARPAGDARPSHRKFLIIG